MARQSGWGGVVGLGMLGGYPRYAVCMRMGVFGTSGSAPLSVWKKLSEVQPLSGTELLGPGLLGALAGLAGLLLGVRRDLLPRIVT